jgi:uncharacterized membrane protein
VEILRGTVLVAGTLAVGLMAGVFGIFANAIMPGLRETDDRTFVGSFQSIDRAIINPRFMATFFGALLLPGLATLLHLSEDEQSLLPWTAAAFVLYLVVVVSTIAVNVPRNDEMKAAGRPDDIADLGAVRRHFDERRWARWNTARAVLSLGAFACLLGALMEFGNAT